MSRYTLTALASLLLLTCPSFAAPVPVGKEEKIVQLPVPSDSMLVVQLNGIEQTRGRLTKLIETAVPDLANDVSKTLDKKLKELLEGRDLESLDKDGRSFLAIGDLGKLGEEMDSPVLIVLPVSDYKVFREKFLTAQERKSFNKGKDGVDSFENGPNDRTIHLVSKMGNVALSINKEVVEQYAAKFEPLSIKKLGSLSDAFLTADLSVYLNVNRVLEVYGQQFQQVKQIITLGIQQGGMGIDKNQLEIARAFFDGVLQAVEDGNGLVLAIMFQPTGLAARLDIQFAEGSVSSKVAVAEKPDRLARLNDLPRGLNFYSASKTGKGLTAALAKLGREFRAAEDDNKVADAITTYTNLITKPEIETTTASAGAGNSIVIVYLDEPAKASAALLKVMKSLTAGAAYSNVVLKAKPKVAETDKKYGGFEFHHAQLEMDFEASTQHIADENVRESSIASMKLLTPEKPNVWFGSDGKVFIRVAAKDWQSAKKLIDGYTAKTGKIGELAAFSATRKQLPAECTSLQIADIGGLIGLGTEYSALMSRQIPGLPVELPKLKKLIGGDSAFLGYSMTARNDSLRFDLFLPADTVKLVRKIIDNAK